MTDQDDLLKELDAALQVEPSRAFADGVRARVNHSRINTQRMWWGLAAAAGIGFATMALWRPTVQVPSEQGPVIASSAPTQVAIPAVPTNSTAKVVAMAPVEAPVVTRREASITRVAVPTAASEPHLEVITNQGAVLRALWADSRGRPLLVAEGEPLVDGLSAKPVAIDPIEVKPIVVGELGKEPGPAGATPIIRRAAATKETR